MSENTKTIGERTEGLVLAALLRAGKVVLLPFGDNQRYDLVVDEGQGKFIRIQCKTGRLRKGSIVFYTCSSQNHRGRGRQFYVGQVELFGVYCPELDKVYLVPVSDQETTSNSLRLEPSPHPNGMPIRWAKDYELK
jgi:hypothetical protein